MDAQTNFTVIKTDNFFQVIETWAKAEGWKLLGDKSDMKVKNYQRGYGFWTAPMKLELVDKGSEVEAKAWIPANLFVRLMTLFIIPKQMGIESGGFKGVLPRKIARESINRLIESLGQADKKIV